MRLLIINPNTTQLVTDTIAKAAHAAASPGTEITMATARFGAEVIASRAEDIVAAHAALEVAALHAGQCDAVIIAASWDSGLLGIREALRVPVVGLTESACTMATLLGDRFGLVTFGARSVPCYRNRVKAYGLAERLAGVGCVDIDRTRMYTDREATVGKIVACANELIAQGAEVIIPSGAVTAGLHSEIQAQLPVPVIDATSCAVQLAESLARLKPFKPTGGSFSMPLGRKVNGVDPAITRLFEPGA
jgi:allantoin racemase